MNKDQLKNTTDELVSIDNVEIQPLSDEDLDGVAGGVCSWSNCSNGPKAQPTQE